MIGVRIEGRHLLILVGIGVRHLVQMQIKMIESLRVGDGHI